MLKSPDDELKEDRQLNIVDEKGTRHKYSSLGSDKAAAFKNHKVRVFQKIKLNKQQRAAAAQAGNKEKKLATAEDILDKPTMTMSDILAKFIAK